MSRSCRSSTTSASCDPGCSRSLIAVGAGSAVGYYFATDIRDFLQLPLGTLPLQVLGVGDAFVIQIKISLVVGIILAMPVLLYQLWAFVAPGLTTAERKTIRPWIPLALVFFVIGVVIAYVDPAVRVGSSCSASRTTPSRRIRRQVRTSTS